MDDIPLATALTSRFACLKTSLQAKTVVKIIKDNTRACNRCAYTFQVVVVN